MQTTHKNCNSMKIFSGNAHSELAKKIAAHLGHELANVEVTSFPDGETFVQINENIRGEDGTTINKSQEI